MAKKNTQKSKTKKTEWSITIMKTNLGIERTILGEYKYPDIIGCIEIVKQNLINEIKDNGNR